MKYEKILLMNGKNEVYQKDKNMRYLRMKLQKPGVVFLLSNTKSIKD